MDVDFFSLPMSAGPQDRLVGRDDGGNPVYETVTGDVYVLRQQPRSDGGTGNPLAGIFNAGRNPDVRLRDAIGGAVNALAGAAWQGVSAPGRAARGEPVTYGDAWATALDWGALGPVGRAPKGALRSGASRSGGNTTTFSKVYHGTPNRELVDTVKVDQKEPGAWFTRDFQYAGDYAKGPDGAIFEANLNMKNPATVLFDEDEYGELIPILNGEILDVEDNVELVKMLRSRGYDGANFPEGNFSEASEAFVVFNDDIIEIVRKYGIAGAAAMLGMSEAEVSELAGES